MTEVLNPSADLRQAAQQAPSRVVLVRPHQFSPNPVTAADNGFQQPGAGRSTETCRIAAAAYAEVTGLARVLEEAGVAVDLFDDVSAETPDSVFPNNWFTTHPDGTVALYPMYAPNRRAERRADILSALGDRFLMRKVVDYSRHEDLGEYLEGTGSMVLDHRMQLAYACRSRRVSPGLFAEFCRDFGYTPVLFEATDRAGIPVYHTNVMMSVGTDLALIGSEMIRDITQRRHVLEALKDSGKTVVELSEEQIRSFAGNCLELTGRDGQYLAMSATAGASLSNTQREVIARFCTLLSAGVPTVESAGGSVRCMIAGNHLPPRAGDSKESTTD